MEIAELLHGSTGGVVSSICILVILVLMFMITVRLYMMRRKKAYLSLTLSLILVIAQYSLIFILEMSHSLTEETDHIVQLLKVLAFIWINLGIYQLYNPTSRRVKMITLTLNVLVVLIAITDIYSIAVLGDVSVFGVPLTGGLLIELMLFALILLSIFFIRPFIGQTIKYMFSLGLFFVVQLFDIINKYMLEEQHVILHTLENYLPVFYFGTLFLIVFNRITELLQAVYQSSIMDGLTGVYNRNYMMAYARRLMKKQQLSVIFCDIDNFKRLNDTQGHQKGDEVLKSVANIMSEIVDGKGIVGRYGGEELVAMLDDVSKNVRKTAELIRQRVESDTPVTVSVGYSTYKGGISMLDLVKQADEAMYVSKTTGKNKITPYSARMPKPAANTGVR